MTNDLMRSLRAGAAFGLIVIFLVLIGFTSVAAQLFTALGGKVVTGGTPAALLVFLGILGIWAGSGSAKPGHDGEDSWGRLVARALTNGAFSGLVIGVFGAVLAMLVANKVDPRVYLFKLSPDTMSLFVLGQGPVAITVIYVVFFAAAALAGALLARLLRSSQAGAGLASGWKTVRDSVGNTGVARQVRQSPATRYVMYVLVAAFLFILPQVLNSFWNYTLGTVGIYVLMGLGLNIVVGLAGLLDLGYVVFFGIGAYSVALLTAPIPHHLLWNFWVIIPIGIGLAATWGVLLGIPVLRLRGDYLAIVTLGFGEIIRVLSKSDALVAFSNGAKGVTSIGQPILFGYKFGDHEFEYMIFIGVLLVIFVTNRLQHSHVGRAWIAIREDETVARAMGINTLYYKLLAFGIGAAFAGLGGIIYASRNQFTGPEDLTLMVSINVLCEIIVGGMGSIPGVIVGAFALKGLPEVLRELQDYRILGFGALLVIMMILRPQGFWPSARRRLEMAVEEGKEEPLEEIGSIPNREVAS